ncbi:hypothetical protein J5N97_005383 [Dioscorea zingiberensis]|uniref:Uncharacterized protein n=1 Tax=Dioscorea zingiberensis TaxID=325984 RepID=A0A9D5DAM6_9LILI|nr:hypothetical protein J5N97_005383 [Dioscorea zingiberensis]
MLSHHSVEVKQGKKGCGIVGHTVNSCMHSDDSGPGSAGSDPKGKGMELDVPEHFGGNMTPAPIQNETTHVHKKGEVQQYGSWMNAGGWQGRGRGLASGGCGGGQRGKWENTAEKDWNRPSRGSQSNNKFVVLSPEIGEGVTEEMVICDPFRSHVPNENLPNPQGVGHVASSRRGGFVD